MAVAFARADGHFQGFSGPAVDIPSVDVQSGDDYLLAIYGWRQSSNAAQTGTPTKSSVSLAKKWSTAIDNAGANIGHSMAMWGAVPTVANSDITGTDIQGDDGSKLSVGSALVFRGVDPATPLGTIVKQHFIFGDVWAPPSLAPSGAAGDLLVSILLWNGFDDSFSDVSGVTITPGGSQSAILLDVDGGADGNTPNDPRFLVTTAPVGSTLTYAFGSSANPFFQHIAFAVKTAGGGGGVTVKTLAALGVG